MSSVTRRTFLQSALASSAALASDSLANRSWMQSKTDSIRVAIVGLGPIGLQQIEHFGAFPIVQIVALCDPNGQRLRTAAERLRKYENVTPKLTTRLSALLDDPTIHVISIATAFPGQFVPLAPLIGSKKSILFDAPSAASYSEALRTMRSISTAKNIIRCRLGDRLAPDAQLLYSNAPSLRAIGPPVEALITSATPSTSRSVISVPALACMNLLLSCTLKAEDIVALSRHRKQSPLQVPSPVSLKSIGFPANRSFLKRIQVNFLGSQISHASLQLRGQHGRLTCHASHRIDGKTPSHDIADFLDAIRLSSMEKNSLTQQAYLAAGLLRMVQESMGNASISYQVQI